MIIYYTATGTELLALSRAVRLLKERGYPLEVVARSRLDVFDSREEDRLAELSRKAVALVLVPHGGPESLPGHEKLLKAAPRALVHVQPAGGSDEDLALAQRLCDLSSEDFRRRAAYLHEGGPENLAHFLLDLYAAAAGEEIEVPPPRRLPQEGIYHPLYQGPSEVSAYLSWAEERLGKRPVVGLWFYRSYWVNGDLDLIDALVEEIERRGGIALPVFHRRFVEGDDKALRPAEVAEKFFKIKGKTIICALINLQLFSMTLLWPETASIYPSLNVPVLQGLISFSPRKEWEEGLRGLSPMDLSLSVAQPEFDGCLISTLCACREVIGRDELLGAALTKLVPVPQGVRRLSGQALAWARLKKTPPSSRRVAVVFHHYPPRADRLGCAFGLDSFESVARLLKRLHEEGYQVARLYETGEELAKDLLSVLISDRRYLGPQEMAQRAAARLPAEKARLWHEERPEKARKELERAWGPPPGKVFVHEGEVLFGGLFNGNVFLTMQPPRGWLERLEELSPEQLNLHDPDLPPTHHYLFFYRWLREEFGAHVVIHVGKHGTLEWLPGKAVALSESCYPDLALADLPHLYPYIVNDPGEGTQAKRRSYCAIIDHLIPPQMAAGRYGKLEDIAEKISEWQVLKAEDPNKARLLVEKIWALVKEAHLEEDLALREDEALGQPEEFIERLHAYLEEVAETQVNDGLHVLGEPPAGKRFFSTLGALVKTPVALPSPHERLRELYPDLSAPERTARLEEMIRRAVEEDTLPEDPLLRETLSFVRGELAPRLARTCEEMDLLLKGLEGGFVPPGPSGAPTRGAYEVLPTGRNFYSVDPLKIPSPEAWETGVKQARALMERHLKDHGRYPRALALVIWGSPTMRTRGDDVAEVLYLLGVRPVWHQSTGRVTGLELIPTEELEFPRVDVTVRTSGFFRDAFPHLLDLLDQAVRMVALLEEPPEENFLAAHVREVAERLRSQGLSAEEALRRASLRVFSDRPGTYGSGIQEVLDSGRWESPEDLGEVFIRWGGYAYGQGIYGVEAQEDFRRVLSRVEVTVKNMDTREMDIFSTDDFNAYHGGLNAAVLAASGKRPASYTGDSSNPKAPKVRTTAEEARFIFRVRVLNPRWIEGMKRHGYKGAGDLSRLVDICFQWDATSKVLDDWMYQALAETYALDADMKRFFEEHNPHALLNITERLLEAAKRGLWKRPDQETLERLPDLFLEMEARVE